MNLELFQNPYNGRPLHLANRKGRTGLADDAGAFFPFRNGYPNFLAGQQMTGLNQKFQRFYDRVGRFGNLVGRAVNLLFEAGKLRMEWLRDLDIQPGDRVLEVSVGTGWNIRQLPGHARYFGVDISGGILDRCAKNARQWRLPLELCQANAGQLPYLDNSFDCVFHIGGINFLNDRCEAIREMIRVAKPGAQVMIIDETAKEIKEQYRKIALTGRCICDHDINRSRLYAPAQFVPDEIRDVEIKLIGNGSMYRLSFIKPVKT